MHHRRDGLVARDLLFILAAIAIGSLVSIAGIHLLELRMEHRTAFLVSHAAGLIVLIGLLGRWWSRRTRDG